MEAGSAGEVRHWTAAVNGISLHVAEQGPAAGPAVLLLHGFPELWLSWRHQMAALAGRGFRALAPDLRGYGDSEAPADAAAYTIFHVVGDLVALLDRLDAGDGGLRGAGGWLLHHAVPDFQEPGRAERAFARYDAATVLNKFYSIESDDFTAPPGVEIVDFLQAPPSPPAWITEEELAKYAEKFTKSGFTGPLNFYRMFDTNCRLTAPWTGAKVTVPAKFVAGDKDTGFQSFGTGHYITSGDFKSNVPDLEVVVIVDGHHFLQQLQPERVNSEILTYLEKFTSISERQACMTENA